MAVFVFSLSLLLLASQAFAHTTLTYDGSTPLPIRVKQGYPMQLNFPTGITDIVTALPREVVEITISKTHPMRVELHALSENARGTVQVNTVAGVSYIVKLSATERNTDPVISVIDAPKDMPERLPVPPPSQTPSAMPRDPLRQVWFTQWGTDPRLLPGVVVTHLRENLIVTADQRVDLVAHFQARGYYGFTQKVTNTSQTPKAIWLPGLYDPYARLLSASLDGHRPPLQPGQQAAILKPGQSVLLHVVYEAIGN